MAWITGSYYSVAVTSSCESFLMRTTFEKPGIGELCLKVVVRESRSTLAVEWPFFGLALLVCYFAFCALMFRYFRQCSRGLLSSLHDDESGSCDHQLPTSAGGNTLAFGVKRHLWAVSIMRFLIACATVRANVEDVRTPLVNASMNDIETSAQCWDEILCPALPSRLYQ